MNTKTMKTAGLRIAAIGLAAALLAGCAARRRAAQEQDEKPLPVRTEDRAALLKKVRAAAYAIDSTECRISLSAGGKSVGGTMRILRGQRIWLNVSVLGITFARGMFTPDSLMYYEKVGKTAFEGRWTAVQGLSPVFRAADYALMENLLCGRPAFSLAAEDFDREPQGTYWAFTHRDARSGLTLTGLIDRKTYRTVRQELRTPDGKVGLSVEYAYGGDTSWPQSLLLTVSADTQKAVRMEYSAPSRSMRAEFPFKIPGGYRDVRELLRALGVEL